MTVLGGSKVVEFGSQEWFRRVGKTSLIVGAPSFHEALSELFGCLIEHSARWIIRFSDPAPPEIMYTYGVSQPLLDLYRSVCSGIDPFDAHWRLYREVGVRALSRFKGMASTIDTHSYSAAFMPAANVSDELGLFLPTIGQSSIGFFLERETGVFSDCEIEGAKAAFPILNSLEKLHIARVFDGLHHSNLRTAAAQINPQPTLVQDRYGVEIFSSASWRTAVAQVPSLETATQHLAHDGPIEVEGFTLNIQRFDKYFPLAPGGRMLRLAPLSNNVEEQYTSRERTNLLRRLTRREGDVFNLILKGHSTSDISQLLCLSKGTVKNVTLRIYKKAGADSKRALVQRYAFRSIQARVTAG